MKNNTWMLSAKGHWTKEEFQFLFLPGLFKEAIRVHIMEKREVGE